MIFHLIQGETPGETSGETPTPRKHENFNDLFHLFHLKSPIILIYLNFEIQQSDHAELHNFLKYSYIFKIR